MGAAAITTAESVVMPTSERSGAGCRARRSRRGLWAGLAGLLAIAVPGAAAAKCLPIASAPSVPQVVPVALPADGSVRLTFVGHSSFLIETPGGASAVTDYSGLSLPYPPDVATMNNAHYTHYTDFPDPKIETILRGWDPEGGIAEHDHMVEDLRVWNVPTNVRDYGGTRFNGNSIFVFEVDGMCIGHLGHLQHTLTDQHLADLGEIDVLLVPVDGSNTLSHRLLMQVIEQISPSVVIPMHYFGVTSLSRFVALIEERDFTVQVLSTNEATLSRLDLPHRTVMVLGDG